MRAGFCSSKEMHAGSTIQLLYNFQIYTKKTSFYLQNQLFMWLCKHILVTKTHLHTTVKVWCSRTHNEPCLMQKHYPCTHTQTHTIHTEEELSKCLNSHQSEEKKKMSWFVLSVTISKVRKPNGCFALFCCLLSQFIFTGFIYNLACIILQGCLWGPWRVFILVSLINLFFFLLDLRGQWKGRRRRRWGSPQSPLCGPWQHLLMRDATHTLTCTLLADLHCYLLPLSLFLPSVSTSCAPRKTSSRLHRLLRCSPPACFIRLQLLHLHLPPFFYPY